MMSVSAAEFSSPACSALKAMEPLLAMTPRFCSSSSRVMPMPLSLTVRVLASLSAVMNMRKSSRFMPTVSSVSER